MFSIENKNMPRKCYNRGLLCPEAPAKTNFIGPTRLRELLFAVDDVTAVYEAIGTPGKGLLRDFESEGKFTSSL